MIIWGFKSYVKFLAIVTFVCGQCHNPAAQRVEEVVRKFTLFFIPLFATKRQNVMTCTFCGSGVLIPKDDLAGVLAQAHAQQAQQAPLVAPQQAASAPPQEQIPPTA